MSSESEPTGKTLTFEQMDSRYAGRWVIAEDLGDGTNGIVLGSHPVEELATIMRDKFPGYGSMRSEIKYKFFQAGAQTA